MRNFWLNLALPVLLTEAWHRYMTTSRFTSWIVDQMART